MNTRRQRALPLPVLRALRRFGSDLRDARRRRRIPSAVLADRACLSRTTLAKIEKGEPGVAMGNYAAVVSALGFLERLGGLADVRDDELGLSLDEERLPQRIRLPRRRT